VVTGRIGSLGEEGEFARRIVRSRSDESLFSSIPLAFVYPLASPCVFSHFWVIFTVFMHI